LSDLREIEDIVTRRSGEIDRASVMHTWFGLLAPKATIGLKSRSEGFKKQRRLWSIMLDPVFMRDVMAEKVHLVASELVELWKEKAERYGELVFDAQDDIRSATLEAMWQVLLGSKLDLLTTKRDAVQALP
jgi:enolase